MSESRQLVLLLAGALVLAVLGVVAATAFPEPCEEVEGIGSLELSFVDAAAALAVPIDDAAEVEAAGESLGIGGWRGAVALPAGTRVLPSDFGFFAVTDTDLVALRPGTLVASAPRDVEGLAVVPVGGTSAGLVTPDRTIAVVSSDYERERCGSLPADGDVLAVERGFAVLTAPGGAVRLVTLSGGDNGTVTLSSPVLAALVDGEEAVLTSADETVAASVRDATVADTLATAAAAPVAAVHGRVLAVEPDAPTTLLELAVGEDGALVTRSVGLGDAVVDAAPTPVGLVALTETGLATDRGTAVDLPAWLEPTAVVASRDGHVGLVVDGPAGPVLLVWGRDIPA